MTDGSRPEDDASYDEGGFDDQPLEEDLGAYEPGGFDDEPLDEDPYAAGSYAPVPIFGAGDAYDSDQSRALRADSLRRVRRGSGGAMFVGILVTAMLVGIPVLGVAVFVLSQQEGTTPAEGEPVDAGGGPVLVRRSGPPQEIVWSDVSKNAMQTIGGVGVKVVQPSVGKARARDAGNRVVLTGNDYLRIGIEVESFKKGTYEYVSWYGREIEQFDGPDRVRLYDASDAELTPHVFADVKDLEGHTPRKTLESRDSLRDALYFDLPEGKSVEDLGDLRLVIPYDSKTGNARYGFKIPNGMIVREDDPASTVDPNAPLSDEDLKELTGGDEDEEMEP
ncbi:MAG TPA: hypothetical protein VGN57_15040 [Pirellulaceae bacterium]|jgi:hypothetical protein|nr:hypothetical protein [Pirellulaceae bacterium]